MIEHTMPFYRQFSQITEQNCIPLDLQLDNYG
nr:MAG TPA: hypothetical protein [Caudoviricetes sp.]